MVPCCLKFMSLGWNNPHKPQALQVWMSSLYPNRMPYLPIVKQQQKYSDNHFTQFSWLVCWQQLLVFLSKSVAYVGAFVNSK